MQFKDSGKKKAITFSFDDGVSQDVRMIQLLNKYDLKATFHISSGRLGRPGISVYGGHKVSRYAIAEHHLVDTYAGHEVASHTVMHVLLPDHDEAEILHQIEDDRVKLSELMGYEVVGLAYPGDPAGRFNYDDRCIDIIKKQTGIKYARSVGRDGRGLEMPLDLLTIRPNVGLRSFDEMNELADKMIAGDPDTPQVMLMMGHCYEMDYESDHWYKLEAFFEKISKRDDFFYGTMKEIYL